MSHRLLFASIHSYLDPSSGAALATRELLELLAARGWDCRAFTCGVLDYQNETPIDDVLASIERPTGRSGRRSALGAKPRSSTSKSTACASHSFPHRSAAPIKHRTHVRAPCTSTWPPRCSTDFSQRFY